MRFKSHDMQRDSFARNEPPQRVGTITVAGSDTPVNETPVYLSIESARLAVGATFHLTIEDATFLRDALNAVLVQSDPNPSA